MVTCVIKALFEDNLMFDESAGIATFISNEKDSTKEETSI